MICSSINKITAIPNCGIAEIYGGSAGVAFSFTAKAEQARAGYIIYINSIHDILAGDIEDILEITHIAVINIQHRLQAIAGVIDRAGVIVNSNIVFTCAIVSVDIYNFTAGVKGAVIKAHLRRAVCPYSIVASGTIEGAVIKLRRLIAPVEGLAIKCAVFYYGFIGTDKSEIIGFSGAQSHILKFNSPGSVKAIVAIVFGAIISRIGHFRADVPGGFVGTQANEGQRLAFGVTFTADFIKSVIAFGELDGVTAIGFDNCGFNRGEWHILCAITCSVVPLIGIDIQYFRCLISQR